MIGGKRGQHSMAIPYIDLHPEVSGPRMRVAQAVRVGW